MPDFTPGPWKLEGRGNSLVGTDGEQLSVSMNISRPISWSTDETNANARLIAQAPAMYEALKSVLDDIEAGEPPREYVIKAILSECIGDNR